MLKLNVPYNNPPIETIKEYAELNGVTVGQALTQLKAIAAKEAVNEKLDEMRQELRVNPDNVHTVLYELLTLLKQP